MTNVKKDSARGFNPKYQSGLIEETKKFNWVKAYAKQHGRDMAILEHMPLVISLHNGLNMETH